MGPQTENEQQHTVEQVASALTPSVPASPMPRDDSSDPALPARLDRYRITSKLGTGGFGVVYQGFDEELRRYVAIKVPHRHRVASPEDVEAYLAEARVLAGLDHAGIVPVYDVGRTEDGLCFVVSKFIEGSDLRELIKRAKPSRKDSVRIVACVAEALHHAHQRRLVHRDIKPANILLDLKGNPIVVDFGLALAEEDFGKGPTTPGTPAYMSPEQARGEGHRVDARSDVYSLGVVLYELLTGQRPFIGDRRSEVLEQVKTQEARPPRQLDDSIPRELDRVCLKALAKRASDRYSTALDLAEDLLHWLAREESHPSSDLLSGAADAAAPAPPAPRPAPSVAASDTERAAIKIIPKGLRSFDAEDADFFLELLPGPRDRERLPESIRFWKKRIEEADPDKTFTVGLLYGPSGCGKSSLIKAGLLPRLGAQILSVYVEAAAEDTEQRLAHAVRRRCPELPAELDLAKMLALVRRGRGVLGGKKILLVIDQFEQWLHARRADQSPILVQALRQCDGEHVQAIILVRDDFWMATTRFMRDLEVALIEGQNSAAVDLFDLRHARKVLAAYGRAFGALPEGNPTPEQEEFVECAVAGLAQEEKVVSVRLSLFAQMVKGKPWTPATLKAVGGAEGVGVTFLEETFAAGSAPPEHRLHQKAARAVLRALLPELGTEIRGHQRSYRELLEASGHGQQPRDFQELLRILDSELRLVTPSDPEGKPGDEGGAVAPGDSNFRDPSHTRHYQLTHDYLVPALRQWLTRKQKETWRGRAEVRLEERTAQWNPDRNRRLLPSLPEYLLLVSGVPRGKRKPLESALLRAAARYHGLRWGIVLCALCLGALGLQQYISYVHRSGEEQQAEMYVDVVGNAAPQEVPLALEHRRPARDLALRRLHERFNEAAYDSTQRLHIAFALAGFGEVDEDFLLQRLATVPATEARNIMTALAYARTTVAPKLLQQIEQMRNAETRARLAMALLHLGDPRGAERVLALVENPAARTAFIHSFEAWHGDLRSLPDLLEESRDPAFQSGICAALGLADRNSLAASEQEALGKVLERLYRHAPEGGVHSAAGWALRQWSWKLPRLEAAEQSSTERGWFVNRHDMKMLAIRPGTFIMGDPDFEDAAPRSVTLTRPFFLYDQEVSVELFKQFLDDTTYAPDKKPKNATVILRRNKTSANAAVGSVSWEDAVLFCNWLSEVEGRKPCYFRERQPGVRAGQQEDNHIWVCNSEVDGYRLPTEAEWEYACRAGSTTKYFFGDEAKLLPSYAFFNLNSERHPWPGAMKLPNGWGLFDMHGNVAEWCWDWYGPPGGGTDPQGPPSGRNRLMRGGDYFNDGLHACSGMRNRMQPAQALPLGGFRVLCTGRLKGK